MAHTMATVSQQRPHTKLATTPIAPVGIGLQTTVRYYQQLTTDCRFCLCVLDQNSDLDVISATSIKSTSRTDDFSMAILDILVYPDKRLRQRARPVTAFNRDLETLVSDMAETMSAAAGIGLAAVQVNVPLRVVVMDLSAEKNAPMVFINPEITPLGGVTESEEGCLSVPGYFATVERVERVQINARDVDGNGFEMVADALLSVCIQHEVDHLNGKVFVDYLSRIKRERIRKKMLKEYNPAEAA